MSNVLTKYCMLSARKIGSRHDDREIENGDLDVERIEIMYWGELKILVPTPVEDAYSHMFGTTKTVWRKVLHPQLQEFTLNVISATPHQSKVGASRGYLPIE